MERRPEPELMDAPEQVKAYAAADFAEPNARFVDAVLELMASPAESGELVDLGCGPGDICIRLARALPGWSLTGIDAGPNMIARGRRAVEAAGLDDRIRLQENRLPDPGLPEGRFDAVVSNSLLHHLADPMALWDSVMQLARAGAWVLVMDLHRPDTPREAARLVDEHAAGEPEILRQDFYNSLCAAYTADEVRAQLHAAGMDELPVAVTSDRHWMVRGRITA